MRQRILAGIVISLTAVSSSIATPVSGQGTWETTLQGRLPLTPGGTDYQAYYDTALNITWLQNANLAATNTFGVTGIPAEAKITWDKANEWITAMNTAAYLGVSDWRLPTVTDTGSPGCNYSNGGTDCGYNVDPATGEMAHMFFSTLGNVSLYNTDWPNTRLPGTCQVAPMAPNVCLANTGPFSNLLLETLPYMFWSGTPSALDPSHAWEFFFDTGWQVDTLKSYTGGHAWAVRSGDIAAVPIPPAAFLFPSALSALAWIRRRRTESRRA